jgi:hypothetical protein
MTESYETMVQERNAEFDTLRSIFTHPEPTNQLYDTLDKAVINWDEVDRLVADGATLEDITDEQRNDIVAHLVYSNETDERVAELLIWLKNGVKVLTDDTIDLLMSEKYSTSLVHLITVGVFTKAHLQRYKEVTKKREKIALMLSIGLQCFN